MRSLIFSRALLLAPMCLTAQYTQQARNAFLGADVQEAFDYWSIARPNGRFHSGFRPYLSSTFIHATDSVVPFRCYPFNNLFFSKTFNEKPQRRNWFNVQLHPITDAVAGYDLLAQRMVSELTGGMHAKLNINDDFTLAFTAYGGSVAYPFFLDTTVKKTNLVPFAGIAYPKANGFRFADFTGYVSWSPRNNKIFNFQAGRGRHFIGDGYRSMLLSDFGPAYPYLRANMNFWRLQYNVWYAMMNDPTQAMGVKSHFAAKYGAFHYLSWNIADGFTLGAFENVIWRGSDSTQSRTFDVNYLNPVIFYRPVEYSLGSPDNSFLGLNAAWVAARRVRFYGQLALDEFYLKEIRARNGWWANKQAWQLGFTWIRAFGINGLRVQTEFNTARPYTYTHGVPVQNYAHYGLPLAHPLGANFKELQCIADYRRDRWKLHLQGMYALVGRDSLSASSNVGQNIFLSYTTRPFDYGHHTGQGIATTLLQGEIRLSYFVVPALNMRIELGYIQRYESNPKGYILQDPYVYVGFRTSFWNAYRDF